MYTTAFWLLNHVLISVYIYTTALCVTEVTIICINDIHIWTWITQYIKLAANV